MRLVVFGANGQTGRLIVEQALTEGHAVTASVRRPEEFPLRNPHLHLVRADVTDPDTVESAVEDQEAVISAIGPPGYTKEPVSLFSQGTSHIITAMQKHRVPRLVCISSTGASFEAPPAETWLYRRVYGPLLLWMGRTTYEDIARMERAVSASDLDWTIARAGGLFDRSVQAGSVQAGYEVRTPGRPGRFTARVDLADALLRMAIDPHHVRATVDVISTEDVPTLWDVFRREAFGRST